MTDPLLLIAIGSVAAIFYVYCAYPLLLSLIVAVRGRREVRSADITPPLSLVISAYNEETVIRAKLENALSLDYPRGCLEIVVISDASSDATDAIVGGYADRGVRLVRQSERRGKTAGLNRTIATLRGELVVFSDANAMYERSALRKLARNFADPEVGCVTGEARYLPGRASAADRSERVYWDYEMRIKRLETAVGSMVGGDGAIYAIRKSLWRDIPEDAINDFLNPLQIVEAGWRAVYEPEAVCYEETAGATGSEYRRRVRIVSRSWRAVFQASGVLNPFRVGLFAWSVLSHKVLRWMCGVFVALAAVALTGLLVRRDAIASLLALAIVVAALAVAAVTPAGRRLVAMLGYAVIINAASVVGVFKGSLGRVSGVWSTPREATDQPASIRVAALVIVPALGAVLVMAATDWRFESRQFLAVVFWLAATLLAYVYIGYPVVLMAVAQLFPRRITAVPIEPTVCLFITANDEEAVIEAKLRNALELDYPRDRLDIVVASDGSVDRTNAIVERFAGEGVRLIALSPRRGKIAAINSGMSAVTTEIVVFSDANTFLEPGALRALVRNFADPRVGGVSGDVRLEGERAAFGRSEDLYYRYERALQHAESLVGSMVGADGALYAIRRRLLVPAAEDTILDDMAIPMAVVRAGQRVVFEPSALAHERGSDSAREEFARKSRVIAGAVQFLARHDSAVPVRNPQVVLTLLSHKILRWLTPLFAMCAFLSSILLADAARGYAVAALAQSVLLTVGLAGCVPALRRTAVVSVAHYFCLVQAAAAVGFVRGVTGTQSVRWRRFVRVPVS
jgi:cellulose synthase/poly-beta-1,6-N-acetylglucosamine synthase-like glycosyltransferase